MTAVTARRLKAFVWKRLRLRRYLEDPGDGRRQPQIAAAGLLWSLLMGFVLREPAYQAVEALVRSPARRALGVGRAFSDDTLAYFTERLDPESLRAAVVRVLRRAKRNKAFQGTAWIGLALDGTGAGRSREERCELCRPRYDSQHAVSGYGHHLSLISVVGTGLTLPFDVEPYGPHDSEYAASQRLLERAVARLGRRFADYVVVDGAYSTAPFLHLSERLGLRVIARVKENLPELSAAVQARFADAEPTATITIAGERCEFWDAGDFDPWESLRWTTVRVVRCRRYKADGQVVVSDWLTDFPAYLVDAPQLYAMARCRWEVENQGFNDAKNRYGMSHVPHHHANSVLIHWLLLLLALVIERLYRLRYLHRGNHRPHSAIQFCRLLRLSLAPPAVLDSS